jgi:DNA-binding GntR family transcriptional regulator
MKPAKSMLMALALGKPKAGADAPDEEGEGDEDMGGGAKMAAARDLIAAVKAGDAEAASQAMTDHYDACAAAEGSEETDSEEA